MSITIEMLREAVQTLTVQTRAVAHQDRLKLKEKVSIAYQQYILNKLTAAVEINDIAALRTMLADNWALVKNSLLSYTATPNSEATLLLCNVATYCAEQSATHAAPLALLMPGIHAANNGALDDTGISIPGDLNEQPLAAVLKTHIEIHGGSQLYPVKGLLACLPLDAVQQENRTSPYWGFENTDAENLTRSDIPEEDLRRLQQHAALTRDYTKCHEDRQNYLRQDKSSLYDHLVALVHGLRMSSKHFQGQEENAGFVAYSAIIAFYTYYQELPEDAKSQIPRKLQDEITLLLELATNKKSNHNATKVIKTCTATRQSAIKAAMSGDEVAAKLKSIKIAPGKREALRQQCEENLKSNQALLKKQIDEQTYDAQDRTLGLNTTLLETLGITFRVVRPADLQDLLSLSAAELEEVLQNDALKAQVRRTIGSLENLVFTIHETSNEKLTVFLKAIILGGKLSFVNGINDLIALLFSLTADKIKTVMAVLAEAQLKIIKSLCFHHLEILLRDLSSLQFTAVLSVLEGQLPSMAKNVVQLAAILGKMNSIPLEQRPAILITLEAQLPSMIKGAHQLAAVLERLSPEQRAAVFTALEGQLPSLIKNGDQLAAVLERLSPEHRAAVLTALEGKLRSLIKNGDQLAAVLKALSLEQCAAVLTALEGRLRSIIKDGHGLAAVLKPLSLEQYAAVLTALEGQLRSIIKDGHGLAIVLESLSPERCAAALTALEAQLPSIITNDDQLVAVLKALSLERCAVVLTVLEGQLPSIIKNGYRLVNVFNLLSLERRVVVLTALEGQLPGIIKDGDQLAVVLAPLSEGQRTAVVTTLEDRLPSMVKNFDQLTAVLRNLFPGQCAAVFTALKVQLPGIIKNAHQLVAALNNMRITQAQRTVIVTALEGQLPTIIRTSDQLNKVSVWLSPRQCTVLLTALSHQLPAGQHQALCASLKDEVIKAIKPVYQALIAGTTSLKALLPVYGLFDEAKAPDVFLEQFYDYLSTHPSSLLMNAFNIYQCTAKQNKVISHANLSLCEEIYAASISRSSFFARSHYDTRKTPQEEDFSAAPEGSRRAKIYTALTPRA